MKRILSVAFGALGLCALTACGGNEKQNLATTVLPIDSVVQSYADSTEYTTVEVSVNYRYPKGSEELEKLVRSLVFQTAGDSVAGTKPTPKESVEAFITLLNEDIDTKGIDAEMKAEGQSASEYKAHFSYDLSTNVAYQDDSLLTLEYNYYTYEGGAHGLNDRELFPINKATLKVISQDELFSPGYQSSLTAILLNKLIEREQVKTQEDLAGLGYNIEGIVPNGNILLSDKGITFCYRSYEAGPYAMGEVEIFVPYAELHGLLSADSFVRRYLPKTK